MEVKEIEFAKLRYAYNTVKAFLESESYEKIRSLDTRVAADLSLYGDDNLELLQKFVEKFELDYKNFDYSKHFLAEDEFNNIAELVERLLTTSVFLSLKMIELLTLNKIQIEKPDLSSPQRELKDLTFRDLLTWYIEKEFKASDQIQYKLKH